MNMGLRLLDEAVKSGCIVRKLMGKDEIRMAEILVESGMLTKGISDDRQRTRTYLITLKGRDHLEVSLVDVL